MRGANERYSSDTARIGRIVRRPGTPATTTQPNRWYRHAAERPRFDTSSGRWRGKAGQVKEPDAEMSLRARILILFGALATLPLLALATVQYTTSVRALEDLLTQHAARTAVQVTEEAEAVLARHASDVTLFSGNLETVALMRAHADGRESEPESIEYLTDTWELLGTAYDWVEFRDLTGARVLSFGDRPVLRDRFAADGELEIEVRIVDKENEQLGFFVAAPRLSHIFEAGFQAQGLGSSSYLTVLDLDSGSVLYHPQRRFLSEPLDRLTADSDLTSQLRALEREGALRFGFGDSTRVGYARVVSDTPWIVMASSLVSEFAEPFRRFSRTAAVVILLVAGIITGVFAWLILRSTRSLAELTAAADAVGRAEFDPPLPPTGSDEVGRLSAAFGRMTSEVRTMLEEVERNRQMAAVGSFAASIAHEIRNPLTSIRLNLQGLVKRHSGTDEVEREALEICLDEIERLDRVAHGVLQLGRKRTPTPTRVSLQAIVESAHSVLLEQLSTQEVDVRVTFDAECDELLADSDALRTVVTNLLVNAAEAMSDGGTLSLATWNPASPFSVPKTVVLSVADSGPGIPSDRQASTFEPFVTTKAGGSGIGLAVASKVIEEHHGSITLVSPGKLGGAEFRIELPLNDIRT